MSWYLDASVLVPMYVQELRSPAIDTLFLEDPAPVFVSSLAVAEFCSALSRRVRMGLIDPEEADFNISLLEQWIESDSTSLAVEDEDICRAGEIVRNYETKLLTPDAIHLGLCQRHGLTMVTLDERLAEAAGMLGVGLQQIGVQPL